MHIGGHWPMSKAEAVEHSDMRFTKEEVADRCERDSPLPVSLAKAPSKEIVFVGNEGG